MSGFESVRGMQEMTGATADTYYALESLIIDLLRQYTYEPVRLPIVEYQSLFTHSVGADTDIVEREMFTLSERQGVEQGDAGGNDPMVLRPEGTANCARMLQAQGLLYNQQQRVYYSGPMFRYERPQKGRYREFYQIGAEVFGIEGPDVDAELLQICHEVWRRLGVSAQIRLRLNNIGSSANRAAFGDALRTFLQPLHDQLDADSQRRLERNPLRILDSKVPATQALLQDAPRLADFIDADSRERFTRLQSLLHDMHIEFEVDPGLVRGLDYYNDTVFEWVTDALGAQGTVCGGGRYNGLVAQLGGKSTPGAGFAIGVDRLLLLCEGLAAAPVVDVYLCVLDATRAGDCMVLARQLREQVPGLRVRVHAGGGKLKNQLRRADQSGARWAILAGDDVASQVRLKRLRDDGGELDVAPGELAAHLRSA